MGAVRFTMIPYEPIAVCIVKGKHFFCSICSCAIEIERFLSSVVLELWENVTIAIFFLPADYISKAARAKLCLATGLKWYYEENCIFLIAKRYLNMITSIFLHSQATRLSFSSENI